MGPDFTQVTERRKIDPEEVFEIPEQISFFRHKGSIRPTHLMVKNHSWAFAYTESPWQRGRYYKSSNHTHFFPIPEQAQSGQLAEANLNIHKAKTRYGQPKFFCNQEEIYEMS